MAVIAVTLGEKFFTRRIVSVTVALIVGYIVAYFLGMVNFDQVGRAAVFALPQLFHFGIDFSIAAIVGFV